MRLRRPLVALAFMVTLGLAPLSSLAQDATPAAGMPMADGVTFTAIGAASGVTLPSSADLLAARVDLDAGASFPLNPNDPTGALLIVETGDITINVDEVDWTISRGGEMSGTMEAVAMGEDATLAVGDVAYVPGSVNGEVSNTGQEAASGLMILIGPAGMMDTAPAATPAS